MLRLQGDLFCDLRFSVLKKKGSQGHNYPIGFKIIREKNKDVIDMSIINMPANERF
jgi:hypothetical protein